MSARWWFDILCEKLKERGDLSEPPAVSDEHTPLCYYDNPQGGLAISQDLIRNKELRPKTGGWPTVWEALCASTATSAEARQKRDEVLNALSATDSFPLLILYELLSSKLLGLTNIDFRPFKEKHMQAKLIMGYAKIFERVAQKLSLGECKPPVVCSEGRYHWWRGVPPYAGFVLLLVMAHRKGEGAGRGKELIGDCIAHAKEGELLAESARVQDFPKKNHLLAKFERAMAIDCHLSTNKFLLKQLEQAAKEAVVEDSAEDDLPSAKDIATRVYGSVEGGGQQHRFAPMGALSVNQPVPLSGDPLTSFPLPKIDLEQNISHPNQAPVQRLAVEAKITWDTQDEGDADKDPCFTFKLTGAGLTLDQLYQSKVVIRTSTRDQHDAVFGDVLYAEEIDEAAYSVSVTPIFAKYSLQYKWDKFEKTVATVTFFAPGEFLPRHSLICVELELAKPKPH